MENLIDEYIHGDKFTELSDFVFSDRHRQSFEVLKDRSGVIFCKTDYISELFNVLRDSTNRYVLITHNSDYCVSEEVWKTKPNCVLSWFAQNVTYNHPDLIPIPIGMERPGVGSNGDVSLLLKSNKNRTKTALLALNPLTNSVGRVPLVNHFKDTPWVTYIKDRIPFNNYINILLDHKYVISPEGNGPDCHRTWEAIYAGVVPIVKKSVLTSYFSDLPILLVDDFMSIDLSMLNGIYPEILNKCVDKATMSYWKKVIIEKKDLLL